MNSTPQHHCPIDPPKSQQSSMADDAPRPQALLCLIEGESSLASLFMVRPTGNMYIFDLKVLIQEQGIIGIAVFAKDLTLWKPATVQLTLLQVDLSPDVDQRERLTGKNVPGSVKLERVLDQISGHWPATTPLQVEPPGHLQIIVELPSGKRYVHRVGEISLTMSRLSSTSSFNCLTSCTE